MNIKSRRMLAFLAVLAALWTISIWAFAYAESTWCTQANEVFAVPTCGTWGWTDFAGWLGAWCVGLAILAWCAHENLED